MPRLVFYILTWKSLINRAQYNSWRCCSRLIPATPGGSFYLPPSDDSSSSEEISVGSTPATTKREPKSKTTDPLNDYLGTRGISPIGSRLQRPWEGRSRYGLSTLLQDIAPSDSGSLFINHVIDEGDYQGSKCHTDDYPRANSHQVYDSAKSLGSRH